MIKKTKQKKSLRKCVAYQNYLFPSFLEPLTLITVSINKVHSHYPKSVVVFLYIYRFPKLFL